MGNCVALPNRQMAKDHEEREETTEARMHLAMIRVLSMNREDSSGSVHRTCVWGP